MRCNENRRVSALLDGELPRDDAQTLRAHIESCESCKRAYQELRDMSNTIARMHEPAPRALAQRIRTSLAAEAGTVTPAPAAVNLAGRMNWQVRPLVTRLAAALAICVMSAAVTWNVAQDFNSRDTVARDVMSAHVRALLQDNTVQVASLDTHTVKPWFSGRVDFTPPVRDFSSEGFPLVGGRLDYVDGRRAAVLVYRRQLHQISVFVWPGNEAPVRRKLSGYNLIGWSKGGMVYWAVSDLNDAELRELQALL